jgi:hypothetical protein
MTLYKAWKQTILKTCLSADHIHLHESINSHFGLNQCGDSDSCLVDQCNIKSVLGDIHSFGSQTYCSPKQIFCLAFKSDSWGSTDSASSIAIISQVDGWDMFSFPEPGDPLCSESILSPDTWPSHTSGHPWWVLWISSYTWSMCYWCYSNCNWRKLSTKIYVHCQVCLKHLWMKNSTRMCG